MTPTRTAAQHFCYARPTDDHVWQLAAVSDESASEALTFGRWRCPGLQCVVLQREDYLRDPFPAGNGHLPWTMFTPEEAARIHTTQPAARPPQATIDPAQLQAAMQRTLAAHGWA